MVSQKSCTLLLVVVVAAVGCMDLCQAQGIFGRCSCLNTIKFIRGNITDFTVFEKQPGCDHTELIITLSNPLNNSTDKICMNTEGKQAKAFLKCWERINKDNSRKTECTDRQKRAE